METWNTVQQYENICFNHLPQDLHSHPIVKKSAFYLKYLDTICSFLLNDPALYGMSFNLAFAGGSIRSLMDGSSIRDVDIYFLGDDKILLKVKDRMNRFLTDVGKEALKNKYLLTMADYEFNMNVYDPVFGNFNLHLTQPIRHYIIQSFYPIVSLLTEPSLKPFQVISYGLSLDETSEIIRPNSLSDIINGFDFVNCSAGISFAIGLPNQDDSPAIIELDEISEHPLFGLSLATKELIINTSSDYLPRVSLPRLLKYIGYGYTVDKDNINNLCAIAKLMGLPDDTINETIIAGHAPSC